MLAPVPPQHPGSPTNPAKKQPKNCFPVQHGAAGRAAEGLRGHGCPGAAAQAGLPTDTAATARCLPISSACLRASNTLCLSILPQFITKFLKYYIFYYIQIHFIAFDNTDNHIPYALMF